MNRSKTLRAVLGAALFLMAIFWETESIGTAPAAETRGGEVQSREIEAERESAMDAHTLIEEKKKGLEEAGSPEDRKQLKEELDQLKRELLRFPKRDRLSFGGDFDITQDSNVFRRVIRSEDSDTLFQMSPYAEFDLGGRQTDLRAEYRWNRQYNAKFSEGRDTLTQEWILRSGRKIAKKTTLSLNNRLGRQSVRDVSIHDGRQIRWDNSHRASLNHKLNRKLTLNFEADYSRRDFPHENFDQDGDWQLQLDPNVFFQITPKTRLTAGYRLILAQNKTKTNDNTKHEFRVGYTGQITGKSSLSLDFAQTFHDPDSAVVANSDTTVSSAGYIWQATPKTSIRLFYSNTYAHSVSDSVSGSALLKLTTRTSSDTLSTSVRFRLHRKINTEFSFDGSHSASRTQQTGAANTHSQTWTFPFQAAVDYQVLRWMRLRFAYTFRHQIGNERSDENRSHTWFFGTNLAF